MRAASCGSVAALVAALWTAGPAYGQATVGFAPARFWCAGVAAAPRVPLLGDADGNGRADILVVYPPGDSIVDFVGTSTLGKPFAPNQARTRFGKDALAAAAGPFAEPGRAAVLALYADDTVRVAHDMKPGTRVFSRDDLAGSVPAGCMPKPPLQMAAGDFDGDGRMDAAVVGADGRAVLLLGAGTPDAPQVHATVLTGARRGMRHLGAGDLGRHVAELVWQDARGAVWRSRIDVAPPGPARLAPPVRVTGGQPGEGLAVGRFSGGMAADIVVGQRLLPGGDAAREVVIPSLPNAAQSRGDLAWLAGDLNGDGRDDLVRVRRSGDRFTGDDLLVQFAGADPAVAGADLDGDGLPDAWETGAVKPGGMDLPAMGCSPGHRDIVVEVQRMPDMPEDRVRAEMARVIGYFASLPVDNPDGKRGIALHVVYREPIATEDMPKPWWELGAKCLPASHRGVSHWMVVYNGGGGQSGMMTDCGGCGGAALYATFIHEFGHQLGLDHNGFWQAGGCPLYPSLMNYPYSYQLGGKGDAIGYSDGRLAGLTLSEHNLSEVLPLPMDKVAFLAGPPYRFRMKPGPDGKTTLVDFNWNGVFGEKRVAADINYGYSTTGGERHVIGKSYTAPAPVALGRGRAERLLVFAGELPAGAPVPASSAAETRHSLAASLPGRLCVRLWQGAIPEKEGAKWSAETEVEPAGVLGDPSAAAFGEAAWVAYPAADGVRLRRVTVDAAGALHVGAPAAIPDSLGAQPTLARLADGLALLLWRDAKAPVGMRLLRVRADALAVGPESPLGFTSAAPVGATAGPREKGGPSLWIGLSQDQDARRPTRWQVRRFVIERAGPRQLSMEWIGGENGEERGPTRIALLWKADRALGPEGQLWLFGGGLFGAGSPWSCHYVATRIADRTVNGGWLTRRYYDEWTCSRSAPGVCFRGDDILFAARWFGNVHGTENDNLFVAFWGSGIEAAPMGDFDDIGFIRDVGMAHSIPWVTE